MFVSAYVGLPTLLKTSVVEFQNVKSEPFDGTVAPIAYVPNWLDSTYSNKTLRFENIPTDAFVDLPRYDADLLRIDDAKNRIASLERSTYITPYMGSYRMNFEEYDGSHLGVDIRAPLGTPVLAIANGVVTKVNDKETADGKYVIIRHDDVPVDGTKMTVYSSYLHLESSSVEVGTKIRKGQPLGKVGLTGITTTPHLHLQIDKASAPFHAYWPYSYSDLNELGIDFFAAVNMGLGKENAIKNTIHPMAFVQDNETAGAAQVAATTSTVAVASASESLKPSPDDPSAESAPKNSAPAEPQKVEPILPEEKLTDRPEDILSAPAPAPVKTVTKPAEVQKPVETPKAKFSDVPQNAGYRASFDRLVAAGALKPIESEAFRPGDAMTRRDAVMVLGELLGIDPSDFPSLPFSDVLPSDASAGYLDQLLGKGVVGNAQAFRPSDAITRAEAAVLLSRASGLTNVLGHSLFRDVVNDDSRVGLLNAFSVKLKLKKNVKFQPNAPLTRAEFVKMVDTWRQKTGLLK